MLAAVIDQGALRLTQRPEPVPGPDEALIKVLLAGICNTDIELTRGYMHFSGIAGHGPFGRLGHEQPFPDEPQARHPGQGLTGHIGQGPAAIPDAPIAQDSQKQGNERGDGHDAEKLRADTDTAHDVGEEQEHAVTAFGLHLLALGQKIGLDRIEDGQIDHFQLADADLLAGHIEVLVIAEDQVTDGRAGHGGLHLEHLDAKRHVPKLLEYH